MDISYSMNDKAIIYSEDIRSSITSLKDVFDFVKKRAAEEEYSTCYLSNLNLISSQLKDKNIAPATSSTNNHKAFVPTYSSNDIVFNQAKFIM